MMKLATIISALIIGSAVAFAPIQTGSKKAYSFQELHAAAVAVEQQQPLGFFDQQAGSELLGDVWNNVEEKLRIPPGLMVYQDVAAVECNRLVGAASRVFSAPLVFAMKV